MKTFEWAIEDIVAAYPALCLDDFIAVAVLLMKDDGPTGNFVVQLEGLDLPDLDGDREFNLRVTWSSVTEARANRIERTRQRKAIVEEAAIASERRQIIYFSTTTTGAGLLAGWLSLLAVACSTISNPPKVLSNLAGGLIVALCQRLF